MRTNFACALTVGLIVSAPVHSAETERSKPSIPEELADAWERLQRALQDWSGQIRERFSTRDAREDQPMISLILKYKDYLRLSGEQVKKLEQLRDNYQRQSIRTDAEARIMDLEIARCSTSQRDVPKVEQKIREVEKLRADLRIARVRAIEQAKALLTAEQRKKFYETLEPRPPRNGQTLVYGTRTTFPVVFLLSRRRCASAASRNGKTLCDAQFQRAEKPSSRTGRRHASTARRDSKCGVNWVGLKRANLSRPFAGSTGGTGPLDWPKRAR